jgi:hypothetical protein
MAKKLKHYVRVQTLNEGGKKSFALVGFTKENDSCVTLVRCDANKVDKEMRHWGAFSVNDLRVINTLDCGKEYKADEYSLVIRLS